VYAQLTRLVGPKRVATTARALGIMRHLNPFFGIGLGVDPVSPLEMARAYSTFANDGYRVDGRVFGNRPRAIARVRNAAGKVVDDNRPLLHPVLSRNDAALLTSILEGVIRSGTGRRAALPDRIAAGKTGTTENYGDAWFVGYTPQLATAVWVGYPNKLIPMLTQFHGDPVAGGTFPAEIWRAFTTLALAGTQPESFPGYSLSYASSKRVTWRDGRLELDNGYCKGVSSIAYFGGHGPSRTANCKPNEVDVPRVVGQPLVQARARLAAQPLAANIVYKPAKPRQRLDVVVDQFPRRGHLSSYDTVTLVLPKATHGVIPNVVGLTLARARAKLRAVGLMPNAPSEASDSARVVAQWPRPRVAAAPKLKVTLAVKGG
jgi:membrane peptidoglycan carboxypeptidase